MSFYNKIKDEGQQGIAILVGMIITTLLLSIVITLTAIFIPKLKVSQEIKKSVQAIYAADAGIEYCLYQKKLVDNPPAGEVQPPPFPSFANGASVSIDPADCTFPIRVTGTYQGVSRFFEVEL